MSLVRVKTRSQVTIPDEIRRRLGVKVGDLLEADVERGSIVLRPKLVEDRDEYTPSQRRRIDAELAKSITDYKAGKSFGPFQTAEEMVADMKARLKKRAAAKKTRRS